MERWRRLEAEILLTTMQKRSQEGELLMAKYRGNPLKLDSCFGNARGPLPGKI